MFFRLVYLFFFFKILLKYINAVVLSFEFVRFMVIHMQHVILNEIQTIAATYNDYGLPFRM